MSAKTEGKEVPRSLKNHLGIMGWVYAGRYWIERYAYLFHRITGLALICYLALHIYVVGERARGREAWEAIMSKMGSPVFKFLEFLLLAAFLVHAVNGLRLIFIELGFFIGKPSRPNYPFRTSIDRQRPFLYLIMLAGGVLIGISIYEFFHLGG
jgi:succinate dehydrogenase cytochrome b556 subunit